MKKRLLFCLLVLASLPVMSQDENVQNPRECIARVKAQWLDSIRHAGGTYSFKSSERSPFRGYDNDLLAFSYPFKGMKHRPTASVTFAVSANKLVFTLYDDVQYACDFDQNGSPAAPADPYTQYFGCKTGTWGAKIHFYREDDDIVVPSKMVCRHASKQYKLVYGNRGRDPYTGRIIPEKSANPYSPWLFSHTMTFTINLDKLAQVMGTTRQDMFRTLLHSYIWGIGTSPERDRPLFQLDDYLGDCLTYCLWKVSGLPLDDI